MTTVEATRGYEVEYPGISVYYQSEPKRLYRVNGTEVPSVTTANGVLDKPGLPWWGMKAGAEGCLTLIREGLVGRQGGEPVVIVGGMTFPATVDQIVELLKERKLTVNHVKDRAGDRGVSVHAALEAWCDDQTYRPDLAFFPETEHGYLTGLTRFLDDLTPQLGRGKINAEVMVGSAKHGFAGRYDLDLPLRKNAELVVNRTPVRGETREIFPTGRWLLDLKTSAGVYPTHFIQLAAYEQARQECGMPKTVGQAVVRVDSEGYYEVKKSNAVFADFAAILAAYNTMADLKKRDR